MSARARLRDEAAVARRHDDSVPTDVRPTPGLLGVLIDDFEPFSTEVLQGVAAAVRGTRFGLLAVSGASHRGTVGWEREALANLGGARIDGAILMTPSSVLTSPEMPVVVIDPLTAQTELPSVASDDFGGAVLATRHLLDLGHRRIAQLAGRPDLESSHRRDAGYRRALSEAGIAYDPGLVRAGHYRYESSLAPARELLGLADRPTAVFAANDASAIAVMEVARGLGLTVPGDLSVVGFDDVPDASRIVPTLTTVRQPMHRIGRAAVRALMTLLEGGTLAEEHVRLSTRLVLRASTAPLG